MKVCDKCKEPIKNDLSVELAIKGECRERLYDLGQENTYFDFCSFQCAIEFLQEVKNLVKIKVVNEGEGF